MKKLIVCILLLQFKTLVVSTVGNLDLVKNGLNKAQMYLDEIIPTHYDAYFQASDAFMGNFFDKDLILTEINEALTLLIRSKITEHISPQIRFEIMHKMILFIGKIMILSIHPAVLKNIFNKNILLLENVTFSAATAVRRILKFAKTKDISRFIYLVYNLINIKKLKEKYISTHNQLHRLKNRYIEVMKEDEREKDRAAEFARELQNQGFIQQIFSRIEEKYDAIIRRGDRINQVEEIEEELKEILGKKTIREHFSNMLDGRNLDENTEEFLLNPIKKLGELSLEMYLDNKVNLKKLLGEKTTPLFLKSFFTRVHDLLFGEVDHREAKEKIIKKLFVDFFVFLSSGDFAHREILYRFSKENKNRFKKKFYADQYSALAVLPIVESMAVSVLEEGVNQISFFGKESNSFLSKLLKKIAETTLEKEKQFLINKEITAIKKELAFSLAVQEKNSEYMIYAEKFGKELRLLAEENNKTEIIFSSVGLATLYSLLISAFSAKAGTALRNLFFKIVEEPERSLLNANAEENDIQEISSVDEQSENEEEPRQLLQEL